MIALESHAEGVLLPVRAQPGSRRNEIRGQQEGQLKVSVTQIAEKGKANKALVALLSIVTPVTLVTAVNALVIRAALGRPTQELLRPQPAGGARSTDKRRAT